MNCYICNAQLRYNSENPICDRCWEIKHRVESDYVLARKIMGQVISERLKNIESDLERMRDLSCNPAQEMYEQALVDVYTVMHQRAAMGFPTANILLSDVSKIALLRVVEKLKSQFFEVGYTYKEDEDTGEINVAWHKHQLDGTRTI